MNKLFRNALCALSVTFGQAIFSGILVNNVDINTITTPEKSVIVFSDCEYDNMVVFIENGHIHVINLSSKRPEFSPVISHFCKMQRNKKNLNQHTNPNELVFYSSNISFDYSYLIGKKSIFLNSSESLNLSDILIESPNSFFKGDKININNCFITGDSVQLESNSQDSFLSSIKFTFKDATKSSLPTFLDVEAEFKGKNTEIICTATNVSTIEILLLPQAFTYNN